MTHEELTAIEQRADNVSDSIDPDKCPQWVEDVEHLIAEVRRLRGREQWLPNTTAQPVNDRDTRSLYPDPSAPKLPTGTVYETGTAYGAGLENWNKRVLFIVAGALVVGLGLLVWVTR